MYNEDVLMRIASVLLLVLVLGGGTAQGAFLTVEALNSNLEFGLDWPYHTFYDVAFGVCDAGRPCDRDWFSDDTLIADVGPLVRQTLYFSSGTVDWSVYEYRGGTFEMDFRDLWHMGRHYKGRFTAPIISFSVGAPNSGDWMQDMDPVFYTLGPGWFDKSLARALGVRQQAGSGTIDSYMTLNTRADGGGDHLSRVRYAEDGGTYIDIDVTRVAEPTSLLLGTLGVLAVLKQRGHLR